MDIRISVRAVILHKNKLLAVRHKGKTKLTRAIVNYWAIPGGGLEADEPVLDCLKREIIEETGIKPEIGNLMYVQQFMFNGKGYLEFFFNITNAHEYLKVDLSKTTHGIKEIEEIKFIDPKTTKILPVFLTEEDLKSQIDKPAKFYSYL